MNLASYVLIYILLRKILIHMNYVLMYLLKIAAHS